MRALEWPPFLASLLVVGLKQSFLFLEIIFKIVMVYRPRGSNFQGRVHFS